MNWQEVCNDLTLRNLPYKIELNEWGQIVMSPASNFHGILQAALIRTMGRAREDGTIIAECSVKTAKGVKVADVAWASSAFRREQGKATPYNKAPEICVEIVSPSNSSKEMEEKCELYFAEGAQEFWLCDEQGVLSFYDCTGPMPTSRLFPNLSHIDPDYLI
ncbi:MAG: Uma2 family endonuclease [Candidatus Methylumidiphilus sp.]